MNEQLTALLVPVAVSIISGVLITLIAYFGKIAQRLAADASEYLIAKIGASDYAHFRQIATDTVLTLTQHPAYKDLLSSEKKEIAIVKIAKATNDAGLNFSTEQISEIIEAVYAEVRKPIAPPMISSVALGELR